LYNILDAILPFDGVCKGYQAIITLQITMKLNLHQNICSTGTPCFTTLLIPNPTVKFLIITSQHRDFSHSYTVTATIMCFVSCLTYLITIFNICTSQLFFSNYALYHDAYLMFFPAYIIYCCCIYVICICIPVQKIVKSLLL